MLIYFARPISFYGTDCDKNDLQNIKKMGFDIVDPNNAKLQALYKKGGMQVFIDLVSTCDFLFFRAFQDGKIGAGVSVEIETALKFGLPIFELPILFNDRILSIDQTRARLKGAEV